MWRQVQMRNAMARAMRSNSVRELHSMQNMASRRLVAPPLRLQLQQHVAQQHRAMGFLSDVKKQLQQEMEKNPELKKSFEEFGKESAKQYETVQNLAKEKMAEVEEAKKKLQEQASTASQAMKEKLQENVEAATEAATKAATEAKKAKGAQPDKSDKADGEEKAQTTENADDTLGSARAYVRQFLDKVNQTKNKVVDPQTMAYLRSEFRLAVDELFGPKKKVSVDEALSSVKTVQQTLKEKKEDGEEEEEYSGTTALVAVKEGESAWQRVSARFREAPIIQGILDAAKKAARTEAGKKVSEKAKLAKDKIGDTREDLLEYWETSQNPWVYRISSIYDGLFGETPMAVAIKEIRRADPDFILEQWKQDIEEYVLPVVIESFLRGNSRDLKKWFGEALYNRMNEAIRERKADGLVMDPNVLGIENVEVIEASAEDKQAPIILLSFSSQQINCIRNRENEVVEGAEDEVLAYYYIFAFQRQYDDETEQLRWKIIDLHMQRGSRYY